MKIIKLLKKLYIGYVNANKAFVMAHVINGKLYWK